MGEVIKFPEIEPAEFKDIADGPVSDVVYLADHRPTPKDIDFIEASGAYAEPRPAAKPRLLKAEEEKDQPTHPLPAAENINPRRKRLFLRSRIFRV